MSEQKTIPIHKDSTPWIKKILGENIPAFEPEKCESLEKGYYRIPELCSVQPVLLTEAEETLRQHGVTLSSDKFGKNIAKSLNYGTAFYFVLVGDTGQVLLLNGQYTVSEIRVLSVMKKEPANIKIEVFQCRDPQALILLVMSISVPQPEETPL